MNLHHDFQSLNLPETLLKALSDSGYTQPTPIQAQAIPHALSGRDVLLAAQTGSGKTAAFLLPLLTRLMQQKAPSKQVQALILVPTRELALQIQTQIRKYGKALKWLYSVPLVGGAPYGGQIKALAKGVQVVIATPGRLLDHLRDKRLNLAHVDYLVLDEADRMLDMGFADDLKSIMEALPSQRQTLMSSATWVGLVGKIAEKYTNQPEKITIESQSAHIEERVYFCDNQEHKNQILSALLSDASLGQTLIFAATKRSSEEIADYLRDHGHRARFIHGDLPQVKRNRIVEDFRRGKCDILVATDVVARGIDVPGISHVINYDLPRQVEDYVHRIGRSGRAGRSGTALNLCSLSDRSVLSTITRVLKREIDEYQIEGLEPKIKAQVKRKPSKKFRGAPSKKRFAGHGDKKRSASPRPKREGGKASASREYSPRTSRPKARKTAAASRGNG